MKPGSLALERITRRFGAHAAVNEISFEVGPGAFGLDVFHAAADGRCDLQSTAAIGLRGTGYDEQAGCERDEDCIALHDELLDEGLVEFRVDPFLGKLQRVRRL